MKKMRMVLNFGHTFLHTQLKQMNVIQKLNHGEAVLIGMMIALKFSFLKNLFLQKLIRN